VGWKLGRGEAERIGPGPAIGHLTSASEYESGAIYRAGATEALHADAEIAVEIGARLEPIACGAALEIVDLGGAGDGPEAVVAANVFHRAFALGPLDRPWPVSGVEAALVINGERRESAEAPPDLEAMLAAAAALLEAAGEELQAGDRLIMGSIVQLPIEPGDHVTADLGPLGRAELRVAA
jgi:2-keto-4-pentenoate hydratase